MTHQSIALQTLEAMSASVTVILVTSVLASSLAAEEACRHGSWRCRGDNTCILREKVSLALFSLNVFILSFVRCVTPDLTALTRVTRIECAD